MKRLVRSDAAAAWLFLAPSGIGFALFYLIPFVIGVYYSFMNNPVESRFVGFANYRELLSSDSFRKAASNTLYFTGISVPAIVGLSLCIAMLLNRNLLVRNALRTAYVLPLVVPVASIVLIWQLLLDWNGSLNAWVDIFGFDRVDWMKTEAARYVVIVVYLWKNIGYNIILFMAGLQQIPKDYYETAQMDGAGRFRQFGNITLVFLTPTLFFVVIMSVVNSFKVFRETYLITGDYPHDSIYMLQHYMNNMFISMDIQKLTAAATMMTVCFLLGVLGLFAVERRFRRFME